MTLPPKNLSVFLCAFLSPVGNHFPLNVGPRQNWSVLPRQTDGMKRQTIIRIFPPLFKVQVGSYQLLQDGAEELVAQRPGCRSGGELGQNPPCKVADPHLEVRVLQQAEDVLQQLLIQ